MNKAECIPSYGPLLDQRRLVDRKTWQTETNPDVLRKQLEEYALARKVSAEDIKKLSDVGKFAEEAFAHHPRRQEEGREKIDAVVHSYRVVLRFVEGMHNLDPKELPTYAAIALLHDTIEDTKVTYEQIENRFGKDVAEGVSALTKDPEHYDQKTYFAGVASHPLILRIKVYDRIENLAVFLRMSRVDALMKPNSDGEVFKLPSGRSISEALEHNLKESREFILGNITNDSELLHEFESILTETEERLEELSPQQERMHISSI